MRSRRASPYSRHEQLVLKERVVLVRRFTGLVQRWSLARRPAALVVVLSLLAATVTVVVATPSTAVPGQPGVPQAGTLLYSEDAH